jgi:hypothetical protein
MTDQEILVDFIKKELLINGTINSAKVRWFKDNIYIQHIKNKTKYLNDSCKITERIYHITNNLQETPKCSCGKHLKFLSINSGYSKHCSSKACARKDTVWKSSSPTKKINYDTVINNFKQHIINNNELCVDKLNLFINDILQKTDYGRKHHFVNTLHLKNNKDELHSLLKLTENIIPFNINDIHTIQNFHFSERIYILKNKIDEIKKCECCKLKNRKYISYIHGYSRTCGSFCYKKNNINHIVDGVKSQGFLIKNNINNLENDSFELTCQKCGNSYVKKLTNARWKDVYCQGCFGDIGISKEETEVFNYVKTLSPHSMQSFKYKGNKEVDVYIPEYNLGVEYNGTFWHSTDKKENLKEYKDKHLIKTKECSDSNIHLLHIFSSEWNDDVKKDVWKSIISNKCGKNNTLYARKCIIKTINPEESDIFLDANHLQSKDKSSIRIGLFYQNELVSLMTFCKSRYNKQYEWELSRFCNKKFYNIVGGASKLLKHFKETYKPTSIITYANRRYSNGNLYQKIGFNKIKETTPNYFYLKKGYDILYSRLKFRKHLLSKKLQTYNEDISEHENMFNNGYRIIYDCGNISYGWKSL